MECTRHGLLYINLIYGGKSRSRGLLDSTDLLAFFKGSEGTRKRTNRHDGMLLVWVLMNEIGNQLNKGGVFPLFQRQAVRLTHIPS